MENIINELIESLLPDDINQTKKESLKFELESHILDAIEFYNENGFSYEKSVERALSDFCNDKKTKKKIKNKFINLHGEKSLTKPIIKICLILIILSAFSDIFSYGLIQSSFSLIFIQLLMISFIILIEYIKKIPRLFRSVISVIILIIFFFITSLFSFLLPRDIIEMQLTDNFNIEEYKTEKLELLKEDNETIYSLSYIPLDTELGKYTNITYYYFTVISFFTEPYNFTYIFSYNDDEYLKTKNYINNKYENFKESSTVNGFEFNYFAPCYHDSKSNEAFVNDLVYFIGTNDKTKQIAIICYNDECLEEKYIELDKPLKEKIIINGEEQEKTFLVLPDENEFNEKFYSDVCGWKYISFFNFLLK